MKKIFLALILLYCTSYGAGFGAGKTLMSGGTFKIKDDSGTSITINDKAGYFIEYYSSAVSSDITVPVDLAVGIKYNFYEEDKTGKSVAHVTTLYGVARFVWDLPLIKPYFQFKAGYPYAWDGDYITEYDNSDGLIYNDLKSESYLSIGLGTQISFVDMSVNYELNNFKLKRSVVNGDKDVTESNVSINIGAKF